MVIEGTGLLLNHEGVQIVHTDGLHTPETFQVSKFTNLGEISNQKLKCDPQDFSRTVSHEIVFNSPYTKLPTLYTKGGGGGRWGVGPAPYYLINSNFARILEILQGLSYNVCSVLLFFFSTLGSFIVVLFW